MSLTSGGLCLAAFALAVAPSSVPASPTGSPAATEPTSVDDSEARIRPRVTVHESLRSGQGLIYALSISVPQGQPPRGGFPVIYVLDGDAWFETAVQVARVHEWSRLPPAIIVGVGYPGGAFFDAPRRSYDLTPPGAVDADFDGVKTGGADHFLAFLDTVAKPWVREHYPVNNRREFLFGHSLGGLFVLYAAYVAPRSFAAYAAASPDTHFGNDALLGIERRESRRHQWTAVPLLITDGEFESRPPVAQREDYRRYWQEHPQELGGQSIDAALAATFPPFRRPLKSVAHRQLAERLAKAGMRTRFVEFPGQEHTPSAIDALNSAIPFFLRQQPRP